MIKYFFFNNIFFIELLHLIVSPAQMISTASLNNFYEG